MKSRGELLDIACHRITETDRPAYVKNSDLRYVAVNEAYAAFFGREISDFIGCRSHELSHRAEDADREDKERRAIVFGTEETSICFARDRLSAFEVQIESFMPAEDRAYIFGIFTEAPPQIGASRSVERVSPDDVATSIMQLADPAVALETGLIAAADTSLLRSGVVEEIFGLLDMGVGIYTADLELAYCNGRWNDLYLRLVGRATLGMNARDVYSAVFDFWSGRSPDSITEDKQRWIEMRLSILRAEHSDLVERTPDGEWLRCIHKRLPDGSIVALRIDVTAIKEGEALLRNKIDEATLYRTLLHDLPVSAFVRGADHRLLYGNEAYFRMTGLTAEASLGKTEVEMFGEEGTAFFAENEAMLRSQQHLEFEDEVAYAPGRQHAVVTRLKGVSTSTGNHYVVGSMDDVSTLKLGERQLTETRARAEQLSQDLENIIGSLPTGVLIFDQNFDLEYANDAFYEIWGMSEEDRREATSLREVMRRNHARGYFGPDAPHWETLYQARIEAISGPDGSLQSEISFGVDRRVLVDGRKLSGNRTLLCYADVSSLCRKERELSEGREALERLGELMTDATHAMSQGLMIVEDGIIMLSNDALPGMLQIEAASLSVGRRWLKIFRHCAARGDLGPAPQEALAAWADRIRRHQPISANFNIRGETWLHMNASMGPSGRWLVVFTDVTDMKDRETELQRLLARSEAADRAKSEFLANMSHEIRTPMNGVLGMAELLGKTGLDARQTTFVDIISKSGNALLTIINDILDFSKIDAGQMQLRQTSFDPAEAVEDVATLLSSQAGEKNVELLVRVSPRLPSMVIGDAGRFRQILTNIVGNAVKFTEHGHVLVDVDADPVPGRATMVTIRVTDTGIGISKDRLGSIFDKFSQVDSSSTRRHEGTGLGLAITAGLVDLFGGYLEVESALGSGSTFKIHLPLPTATGSRGKGQVPVNVKGAQILVIDDHAINRQILTEQLAEWGFQSVAVADGPTGLAILSEAADIGVAVDAVILDYNMPGMTGADIARTMRQDRRFDGVPLIFLTSMDVAGADREYAALSGDAHLMKPARANVLRNTVIEVVRTARQRRSTGEAPRPLVSEAPEAVAGQSVSAAAVFVTDRPAESVDILVAEDNEVNQIVFTQILQAAGAHFLIVRNGEEAVAAYRRCTPSLIMMDVSMPIMNGLQATRAIREIEAADGAGRHVPIIGVTAHALESDRELCMASGMDDYMSKPISPELLEAKIGLWMKNAKSSDQQSSV
ncbi:response regulator [Rhizobium rhododendri]|uniref:histidine kinase n=1 Tax=Rhizobium rhododendri TaxID=2506430 RepID=A0ABY8ID28_9HYPH|nr:response regulator [Rhizobium rhododendri]WFS21600.1 response regulator [Rhizobium rhododendri]